MTIQWTAVSLLLYTEIFICLVLLLHWISPSFWVRLFDNRLFKWFQTRGRIYGSAVVFILLFLFTDALREMNRLSHVLEIEESDQRLDSLTNELMRLFHAQRNYYITGFALVLLLLINRIVDLIWKNALFKMTYNEALKQVEMKNNKMNELLNGENVNSEVRSLALKCIEIEEKIRKTEIEYEDMEDQVDNLKVEYEKVCHLLKTAKNV